MLEIEKAIEVQRGSRSVDEFVEFCRTVVTWDHMRKGLRGPGRPPTRDWDHELAAAVSAQETAPEVAKRLGVKEASVHYNAGIRGIRLFSGRGGRKTPPLPENLVSLIQAHAAAGDTMRETAAAIGVRYDLVRKLAKRHGVAFRLERQRTPARRRVG